jgi:hypothetical protein
MTNLTTFGSAINNTSQCLIPSPVNAIFPDHNAICPPARSIKQIAIAGVVTAKDVKKITARFNLIRSSNPIFQQYFDFVLSYLNGFNVLVVEPAEFSRLTRTSSEHFASYDLINHTMIINVKMIKLNFNLTSEMIRHEMRHAYWHAMQIYTAGNKAYGAYCFMPTTVKARQIMRKHLDKGDKRVSDLRRILIAEINNTVSSRDKKMLQQLREKCKPEKKFYSMRCPVTLEKVARDLFKETTEFDFANLEGMLLGECKIIGLTETGITVEMLDPLKYFVYTVEHAKSIVNPDKKEYTADQYEYEREAFLYGSAPPSLINKFYPEMVNYTESLNKLSMEHPTPYTSQPSRGYKNMQEYALSLQGNMLRDKYLLDYLIRTAQTKDTLKQISNIIDTYPTYGQASPNEIRFALDYFIGRGLEVREANRLMARLSDRENDGLGACRYYHRAFKQKADFKFEDYERCLIILIENNKWGEAKIICQKALQDYRQSYEQIPQQHSATRQHFQRDYLAPLLELEQKIKSKRKAGYQKQ